MLEQSPYLASWRAAVKRATYETYKAISVAPEQLPLFRGPVEFSGVFYLDTGDRVDGPPDYDKLLRSTWDALTDARVWESDARVVRLREPLGKRQAGPDGPGAYLMVSATDLDW